MPATEDQENGFGIAVLYDPATISTIPRRKIVE
jgi:hypothetical protein